MKKPLYAYALLLGVTLSAFAEVVNAAPPLPALSVSKNAHTVSGLSSGGYMATQMHVAFSRTIRGAGVIAAGPYHCADTGELRALGPCMSGQYPAWCAMTTFNVQECEPIFQYSVEKARALDAGGEWIDPLKNLKNHRVYLLAGTKDQTVFPSIVEAGKIFYEEMTQDYDHKLVKYEKREGMSHTFPTQDYKGNDCKESESPFISDCGLNGAGEILQHLYPGLVEPQAGQPQGQLIEFDQRAFLTEEERHMSITPEAGLADTGWVYVPQSCSSGKAQCSLHVAFHGCKQSEEFIGRKFAEKTGYNRWADANNLVILYPQTRKTSELGSNPKGCWDWWGYTTPAYDTQKGLQMIAVMRMIKRLEMPVRRPALQTSRRTH